MATAQRPRTPRRSPSASSGPDPASLGLILVLVALVFGAILLYRGGPIGFHADGEGVEIGAGNKGDDKEQTDEGKKVTSTTVAPPTTVAPAEVTVVVANGAGVSGLAKRGKEFLAAQGYSNPANAASDATATDIAITSVYFAPGLDGNAQAVAAAFGLPGTAVQALPTGAALAEDQPADAGLIVVLGTDAVAALDAAGGTSDAGGSTTSSVATSTTAAD